MLRELCGRRLRHDRSEPLQLGDELVGRRALRELRVELGEGIRRLEAGLAVERACTVPQLVLGRDQAMTDQTPDREPVARGKSEVLPSVLASHGRIVLDPGCEEVVGTAAVCAREYAEREV